MVLSVKERLVILLLLQGFRGDIVSLRVVSDLRHDVGFSDDELADIEFDRKAMSWNGKKEKPKDIKFGEVAKSVIREQLQELNNKKQLTEDHVPLYERFCEAKDGKSTA